MSIKKAGGEANMKMTKSIDDSVLFRPKKKPSTSEAITGKNPTQTPNTNKTHRRISWLIKWQKARWNPANAKQEDTLSLYTSDKLWTITTQNKTLEF